MTAQTAQPSAPALAGFVTLDREVQALHPDPVQRALCAGGRVNDALRDLLDQHPELELLPLELLATHLMATDGHVTPPV